MVRNRNVTKHSSGIYVQKWKFYHVTINNGSSPFPGAFRLLEQQIVENLFIFDSHRPQCTKAYPTLCKKLRTARYQALLAVWTAELSLLGYDVVTIGKLPTFQSNVLPRSSGSTIKVSHWTTVTWIFNNALQLFWLTGWNSKLTTNYQFERT